MSFKTFVILLSVLGIFYIPAKILISNHNLKEIDATVTKIKKSGDRVSYYLFETKEYSGVFYNSGNGTLSYFKNDETILKNSVGKKMNFYIVENENLQNSDDKFYVALDLQSKWTDLFYYNIRSFTKFFFAVFCIFLMTVNAIASNRYKMKVFDISVVAYFALFFLVLAM